MKTAKEIQGYIYRLLNMSELATNIDGRVYRDGMRPRDSQKEDAVVVYTTGTTDGQIGSGVVTINIFTPDIDPFGDGVLVENAERTAELEGLARDFFIELQDKATGYKIGLQQAIMTYEESELYQHFVSLRLTYDIFEN